MEPVFWYLVDYSDDIILFYGRRKDCIEMQSQSYGGLSVVRYPDLTDKMKSQALQNFI
jgi:hypothetical protein